MKGHENAAKNKPESKPGSKTDMKPDAADDLKSLSMRKWKKVGIVVEQKMEVYCDKF